MTFLPGRLIKTMCALTPRSRIKPANQIRACQLEKLPSSFGCNKHQTLSKPTVGGPWAHCQMLRPARTHQSYARRRQCLCVLVAFLCLRVCLALRWLNLPVSLWACWIQSACVRVCLCTCQLSTTAGYRGESGLPLKQSMQTVRSCHLPSQGSPQTHGSLFIHLLSSLCRSLSLLCQSRRPCWSLIWFHLWQVRSPAYTSDHLLRPLEMKYWHLYYAGLTH